MIDILFHICVFLTSPATKHFVFLLLLLLLPLFNSTKAFSDIRGLIQHCQETGHKPQYSTDIEGAKEAEPPVFLSYVNMVLSRALGERYAKWGREFIDPQSGEDAKEKRR